MSLQHSSPSPTSEERQNRFAAPSLNQPTTNLTAGEAGNHFSARAASQPPRSSSTASNTVLPSPTTVPRSPWSQSQSSSVKHPRDRYLSPTRTSGIPMPSQTRSSSFSGAGLGAQPHSFSGLGSSGGAGPAYFSRFDSTFEDDESLLDNPQYGVEDDGVDDDDVDAMIGRIRPSADPYDEYSDSPVYSRRGVGIAGGGGAGRYNIGGGRLPPSLSSSLSPSQLPGTVPLMSPSPRSSTSSSLASQIMKDDVRGRTYAPDLSRSRSQSLATTTVGRLSAGVGAAGMYGLPSHNPHGYSRDTSGLGSTMASWNGNDSDHNFSLLRERLDSSRSRYGSYNEYSDYGDKLHDNSNQSPFLRDVSQIMRDDAPLRELWDHGAGGAHPPRGLGLRNSLSRAYSGGGGFNSGARSGVYPGGGGGATELEDIPGSGATSRRHSVSVVQPVRRGSGLQGELAGSAVDDEYEYEYGQPQGGLGSERNGSSGFGALGMAGMGRTASMSGGVHPHVGSSSGRAGVGRGSLMLSDEDLLDASAPMPDLRMGMHGGMHPVDALNSNFGMMNLNDINQSLYQHQQQQQSALEIPHQRRGSVSPGTGAGGLSHDGLGSSPGHQYHEKDSAYASQEHTPQQHNQPPPPGSQLPQGPNGLGAGTSYASRARSTSQSQQQGGSSPTMGRGMGIPPQGFYSQHPSAQPQQGPTYPQVHAVGMPRRISNASGSGPVLDMSYGVGPHGHHPGSVHQQHPHQTHPHGQHALPQHQQSQPQPEHALGRGVPLSAVPHTWKLFIVEFKAGRTDLFYLTDAVKSEIMRNEAGYAAAQTNGHGTARAPSEGAEADSYPIKVGDLVIVEADRGRDLGRVVNDNISVDEVEAWLDAGRSSSGQILDPSQQPNQPWGDSPMPTPISPTGVYAGIPPPGNPNSTPGAAGSAGSKKEINPKQIYGKAGPAEASLLAAKMSDEMKALQLCQSKVRAKKLPMEVVDAEYQWDRRKLTFYFVADKRIDFRELVRELFRLYKTRIWMASLQGGGGFEQ